MNKAYLVRGTLPDRSGSHEVTQRLVRLAEKALGLSLGEVQYLPGGKPVFSDPAWHLSVSHSAGELFLALAPFPIGVDIELRRPVSHRVARRFFDPRERDADFFFVWTAKEAVSKISGGGLQLVERILVTGSEATLGEERFFLRQWEEEDLVITLAAGEPFAVEDV